MRIVFLSLVLVIVSCVLLGCLEETESIFESKTAEELIAENRSLLRDISKFEITKERPIYFQQELRGLKGSIEGSWSSSYYHGTGGGSGSIEGKIDNARSISFFWKGSDGTLYPITLSQDMYEIKPREGKPSSVLFHLSFEGYIEEEIKESFKGLKHGSIEYYTIASQIGNSHSAWRRLMKYPSAVLPESLNKAVIYATRRDLERYNGLVIPPGK